MSGLESIALAVAHLEEQRQQEQQQQESRKRNNAVSFGNQVISSGASATLFSSPPVPQALPMGQYARVVSNDDEVAAHSASSPSPKHSSSSFGYILADPLAWLKKTQDRPPLKPPTDPIIYKIQPTDVLCGRGGETNHHPGNIQYRLLVKAFQPLYVSAKRREKPLIAQCIVYSVRQVGGRFLKRSTTTASKDKMNCKEWEDVGNTKAREKTSQALREGAPELRGDGTSSSSNHKNDAPVAPVNAMPSYGNASASAISSVEATLLSAFLSPLQQALCQRSVVVTPQTSTNPSTTSTTLPMPPFMTTSTAPLTTQKRPSAVIISDGNSDSESSSCSTANGSGGPRLKRFKKRFQEESSST